MSPARLKEKGFAELIQALRHTGDSLGGQRVLSRVARAAMKPVLETARQMAPKRSGALAAALVLAAPKPKGGPVVAAAGLAFKGKPGSRWHFEEFGTRRQKARPFLRPAFAKHQEKMLADLRTRLNRAVRSFIKRSGGEGV